MIFLLCIFSLCILSVGINSDKREIHPLFFKRDVISVYYDSLAVLEICKLDNTRSHDYLDWWYFVTVDNQTRDMFHISTSLEVDGPNHSCTIDGWVYKKDCKVLLGIDKYEGDKKWKYLYEKPDSKSRIIATISSNEDFIFLDNELELYVEEMDLTPGSRWAKIIFIYKGTRYSGWTERYITDP